MDRVCTFARGSRAMIRPVLTEVALFLTPFLVYAVFLWATQAGGLHPPSPRLPRPPRLVIGALVLTIGRLLVFGPWGGSPPRPAHVSARPGGRRPVAGA